MSFYDNVKEVADQKKMSIREIEIRAGVANGTIGKWRTGQPMAETLFKVAAVLEVPAADLMKGVS